MDKAQNELLKTYYRARNITIRQDENGDYYKYELNPMAVKSGLVDISILDGVDMSLLIAKDPTTFDVLEENSYNFYFKFTSMDITEILRNQPQLYSRIAERINMNKLTQTSIARILGDQPQLHTKFNLSNLNSQISVLELLKKQPRFIYAVNLEEMNGHSIGELLQEYRDNGDKEAYKKFMEAIKFTELDDHSLFSAFFKVPETMDLFDQAKITRIFASEPDFAGSFIKKNPELFEKIRPQAMQLPKDEMIKLLKSSPKTFFSKFRTRFDELTDEDIDEIVKNRLPSDMNSLRGYIKTYSNG